MDLEEEHLHETHSEKIIHCSDGIIIDHAIDSHVDNCRTNICGSLQRSQVDETGDGNHWFFGDLSRRLLQVVDWAGERLASAVGLTGSKFDEYLWERENQDKELAEREANTFIINPTSIDNNSTIPLVTSPGPDGQKVIMKEVN
ncbi:unnamed protein product [Rodentolepis nana]|uniref:Ovule protein n=1 Tax=Rodentolepis nana TaxID=102285 RepID=A0A0R3T9U3_RODNA|nr:unnamed protein product [Rodentolepis nana]